MWYCIFVFTKTVLQMELAMFHLPTWHMYWNFFTFNNYNKKKFVAHICSLIFSIMHIISSSSSSVLLIFLFYLLCKMKKSGCLWESSYQGKKPLKSESSGTLNRKISIYFLRSWITCNKFWVSIFVTLVDHCS